MFENTVRFIFGVPKNTGIFTCGIDPNICCAIVYENSFWAKVGNGTGYPLNPVLSSKK
jgi:hypothetical protein